MTAFHNYTLAGYDPADGLTDGRWVINRRTRILEWWPNHNDAGDN